MRVLVTGANGFIGSRLATALEAAGHEVLRAVRDPSALTPTQRTRAVACDFARDTRPGAWEPRLDGIDAVVNCAGILRETSTQRFESVHVAAPLALAQACVARGVRRFVQVSALGHPDDGEFIASKHRGDAALLALPLPCVVLRPSVVYAGDDAYGGTRLLRALAALPGCMLLPAGGNQRLQPIALQDLGVAVVAAVAASAAVGQVVQLGGPRVLSLREYLALWREWMGLPPARIIAVPGVLVRIGTWFGERFGSGPMGRTMHRMLERGNVLDEDALARARQHLGLEPRDLREVLDAAPGGDAARESARWYLLAPLLRAGLVLMWLGSGIVGLTLSREQALAPVAGTLLAGDAGLFLARAGGVLDLLLALALCLRPLQAFALRAMFALTLAYTLSLGLLAPALWLDPLGGLLKNLVLLPATLVALNADPRRR